MKTQILVDDLNRRIYQHGTVEKGFFENDPETECYRVTTSDNQIFYAVAQGFTPFEVEESDIPTNFRDYIYSEDGKFIESKIIDKSPGALAKRCEELETELTNTQLALTELYESLNA